MKTSLQPSRLEPIVLWIALLIVITSVWFTNRLASQLREEEQRHVEQWAEATERLIQADEREDISFYMTIIEGNATIPVYMVDAEGNILDMRNVSKPVADPRELNGPIELRISDDVVQYIYYGESVMLKRLRFFPYIEFGIIFLFVLVAVMALHMTQRSEQDRVWVGLSKETAHQLGTPISALNAWQDLLKDRYPDDPLIPQMRLDINRLKVVAERFSKIGSEPELQAVPLLDVLADTLAYMRSRVSRKVMINYVPAEGALPASSVVYINVPLFSWVIENLIKNAVDAMNGAGTITMQVSEEEHQWIVDVSDTGRGIDRRHYKTVFLPGYTSKQRGWGLGLSLSKRIIEDYHGGRLFVKTSEQGVGTTMRIILKKPVNS